MSKSSIVVCFVFALMQPLFSQNIPCIVKENHEIVSVTETALVVTEQLTLQINNMEGNKYGIIKIPFSKTYHLGNIKARIEMPDGTLVRELKNKEIIEKSNIADYSLFQDDYVKEFTLRHNVYPYVVKVQYTYTLHDYCQIADWQPAYVLELPVEDARLVVMAPQSMKLNISNRSNVQYTCLPAEGAVTYTWQTGYLPFAKEVLSPAPKNLIPRIIVTTNRFHWMIDGQCDTWQNYGAWHNNLRKGLDVLPDAEKTTVHALTDHLPGNTDKVEALYKYLQQSKRYINVSVKYGGLQPYPADYVCANGYGDCKALSNYMVALLKEAGIKAIYSIVNAGAENEGIDAAIPSAQFNHAIVCVPLEKDTCWLECTGKYLPAGYLGSFTQNRLVLLVDDAGGRLVKTPALTAPDCEVDRYAVVDETNGTSVVKMQLRGPHFEYVNAIQNEAPANYHEYILDNYLFTSLDVKEWKFTPCAKQPQVTLEVTGQMPMATNGNGGRMIYTPHGLKLPKLEKPELRTLPVVMQEPTLVNDTLKVMFPNRYSGIENDPDVNVEASWGTYSRRLELNGNTLLVIRRLYLPAVTCSPENYNDFYSFVQQVKRLDKEKLILNQSNINPKYP